MSAQPNAFNADKLEATLSLWAPRIAGIAGVWFFLANTWELFGILPAGHLGNATGAAMAGENILQWKTLAAVLEYTTKPPVPGQYYCHHPYGVFLIEALSHKLFGHHWASIKLPAVILSSLTPWLLYRFTKALWGPLAAAVATVAFTFVPIDLAFGNFSSLEVMVIFFGLLFSWGTVRLWQTWQNRYLWPVALGALGACHSDWVGFVLVGSVGIFAFTRAYLLPSRFAGFIKHREHAKWFAWSTAMAVLTLVFYLSLFAKAGKLGDLLGSAELRSSGASSGFSAIFSQRRIMWMLFMLPYPTLLAILLSPLMAALRLRKRSPEEFIPFAWWLAASFQYFVFKQGADVHIFWPHYYGVVAALGFAACIPSFTGGWFSNTVRSAIYENPPSFISNGLIVIRSPSFLARVSMFVSVLLAIFLTARVGVVQLYQSRLTGGRFDDGGRYIAVDQDRAQFAQWATANEPPEKPIGFHRSFIHGWNVEYAAHHPITQNQALNDLVGENASPKITLFDARYATVSEQRSVAEKLAVKAWGPYWQVDRTKSAPFAALQYQETQPNLLARYFITGSDLIRTISNDPDPWQTWEWADLLGLATTEPTGSPNSPEQARIAYNLARSKGDETQAQEYRKQVERLIEPRKISYSNDLHLIGLKVDRGAATVVTILWETGTNFIPFDGEYLVRSKVIAAPWFWTSAIDYFEKEMAPPMTHKPALWKPGRIYSQSFIAMKRPGKEKFEGIWSPKGSASIPKLPKGKDRVELWIGD